MWREDWFIGYAMFTALESAEFRNEYLRSIPQTSGMLSGENRD